MIVKPNSMGASHFVGKFHVSEVHGIEDFITSIFPYSKSVLIQEFIYGTEYTCGVMNEQGRPTALPVIRVSTASGVLGHQEKHQHGSAQITFEDSAISKEIQRISIELFELFRVNGMVRFDFLVCNHGVFFLEGNLIPGFSKGSAFPMMLYESGQTLNDFLLNMIDAFSKSSEVNKFLPYSIC